MYRRTKAQIVSDAVCGILMLVSLMFFILVGIFAHIWHPTWIVIPCSGLVCGIISITVNTYVNLHRHDELEIQEEEKKSKKEQK